MPCVLSRIGSTLHKTATHRLKSWTLCRRLFTVRAPSASSRHPGSFFQRIAGFLADRRPAPTHRRTAYLALETLEGRIVPTLTLTLGSSLNPSVATAPVTLTATLGDYGVLPTGTITFDDNGSSIAVETLASSPSVTFTTSSLANDDNITATYSGDSNYPSLTSSDLTEVVNSADASTGLTSSANPSTFGQSVTFAATVSPVSPAASTPTGSVSFYDGGTFLDTVGLSSGDASYTTAALNTGSSRCHSRLQRR